MMRALVLVVSMALVWGSASAQTASPPMISVVDENGVAVSGAHLLLQVQPTGTTTQLPAVRCETDFNGRCSFPGLAAGAYQLKVQKPGFYEVTQSDVQMAPGGTVEVAMSHQQEVREVVNVKESPPEIDAAQVSAQESLSGIDIIDIPYATTNDYRNVLNYIPGVVQDQSGQPHVAGAETYQTETLLDGFNVTQPANGQLLVRISTDSFRSIQVEPAREPAEYGKGPGGVLSLNTGVGDDHFRFLATDFIPSVQDKHGLRFDEIVPRLTFSGPIEKGKAWFYDAFDGGFTNVVYTELPVGQDNDHVLRIGNLFKVQTNVTNRDILTTRFLINHLNDEYDGLSPYSPQLSNPKDAESVYVADAKNQHYFKGGELLETGFGFDQYNAALTPYGTQPYYTNTVLGAGGNYYLTDATHARRWQGLANLFLPSHQWHGRHDLKMGVDLDRIFYDAEFSRQPVWFLTDSNALTSTDECLTATQNSSFPCTRYSTFSPAPLHTQYNAQVSAYAEDRWGVTNRLLIEPGVRLDWDEIVRHAEIAPRLAGTYVLDNSGTTKISAGIGLLYGETPIFLVARPFTGTRQDTFYTLTSATCSANCINVTGPLTTSFLASTGTLQVPRFVNWSLGLEKKLPKAIYMKAEFLEKRGTRDFVYNTLNGAAGGNFFLENTRDDHYDAFQITLRHNFRESYMLMGSYTHSRSWANQVLDFNVDNPILSAQQEGVYPWDTPNRFLSWGYLPFFKLPILHKTEIAYSMEARTGFAFSDLTDQQEIIGVANAHRYPEYFTLNVQLEKKFHFLGYYLALRGGMDNITGRCDPYVVNNVIDPVTHPEPTFSGCIGRAFTSRIRLLGRK
ncbi:MAG TPA: carboxypeptidase regulatory-like domain-containing protein [Verrucomicrobiae bacterium]|nr:carboxypeptidase regulatory-like domain-containing protein [Verrucomicrobiae bacterium]